MADSEDPPASANSTAPEPSASATTSSNQSSRKRLRSESPVANDADGGATVASSSSPVSKRRREEGGSDGTDGDENPLNEPEPTVGSASDAVGSTSVGNPPSVLTGTKRRRDDDGALSSDQPSGEDVGGPLRQPVGADPPLASIGEEAQQDTRERSNKRIRLQPTSAGKSSLSSEAPANPIPIKDTSGQVQAPPELQPQEQGVETEPHPPQSPILSIPPEIFYEILLSTGSLFTVLSFSRACKSFRTLLLDPSSSLIWKRVRNAREENNFGYPTIPDFTLDKYRCKDGASLFQSEEAFASFVFGGYLICEVCGNATGRHYASYALRARLCPKQSCRLEFKSRLVSPQNTHRSLAQKLTLVLRAESNLRETDKFPPGFVRASDLEMDAFFSENKNKPNFKEILARRTDRVEKWMQLCTDLVVWRNRLRVHYHTTAQTNKTYSKRLAEQNEWDWEDLMNCTSYGPYHSNKCHIMERVSEIDVAVLLPTIFEQFARLKEQRRTHRRHETYHIVREQITQYHKHLLKTNAYPVLPTINAFRALPIFAMLQNAEIELPTDTAQKGKSKGKQKEGEKGGSPSERKKGIKQALKENAVLNSLVKDQIERWVEKAREDLGKLLNPGDTQERWKKGKLSGKDGIHPVERVNARFRCKRCTVLPHQYVEDECFDFKGACAHECGGALVAGKHSNRKKNQLKWDAANFERDDKAISVINKCIELLDPQGNLGANVASVLFGSGTERVNIVCTSCELPIAMSTKNMIGHSHRHEDMTIDLFNTVAPIQFLQFPFVPPGRTMELLAGHSKIAKTLAPTPVFACRFCYTNVLLKATAQADALKGKEQGNGEDTTPPAATGSEPAPAAAKVLTADQLFSTPHLNPRGLTFAGIRSHLASKHHITKIRDEDYFLKS